MPICSSRPVSISASMASTQFAAAVQTSSFNVSKTEGVTFALSFSRCAACRRLATYWSARFTRRKHRTWGAGWANSGGNLMDPLLGSDNSVSRVVRAFSEQSDLGLLAPEGSIMDLRRITANMFNTIWLDRLLNRMDRPDLIGNYAFQFPAGSMYWFRVAALAGLDDFVLAEDEFEEECGQTDGTLAHAVERLVALFAEQRGYRMGEISIDSGG